MIALFGLLGCQSSPFDPGSVPDRTLVNAAGRRAPSARDTLRNGGLPARDARPAVLPNQPTLGGFSSTPS
ncbi:MAG: hypothetical protein RLN60_00750 [Phycisphaerales bacterium]